MYTPEQEIESAIAQLARSQRGQAATKNLHNLINENAGRLDTHNKNAIARLLILAETGHAMSVPDALNSAIKKTN